MKKNSIIVLLQALSLALSVALIPGCADENDEQNQSSQSQGTKHGGDVIGGDHGNKSDPQAEALIKKGHEARAHLISIADQVKKDDLDNVARADIQESLDALKNLKDGGINWQDDEGNTIAHLFMYASDMNGRARNINDNVLDALVEAGADFTITNKQGLTPYKAGMLNNGWLVRKASLAKRYETLSDNNKNGKLPLN